MVYSGNTMERTQIYLPKTQIKQLKHLAQQRRTTLSDLVRDAVEIQYTVKKPTPWAKKEETLREAAERIGKLGKKGPKDLSSRLDEYLYGNI